MATAVYPTSVQTFATKNPRTDNIDPVMADDVNLLYVEVTAIESILGTAPNTSTWTGTFDSTTSVWSTMSARLANVEVGLYTAYSDRVKSSGGSTISPAAAVVGVAVKAAASATANLAEFRDASNNLVTAIGPGGYILAIDGGTA